MLNLTVQSNRFLALVAIFGAFLRSSRIGMDASSCIGTWMTERAIKDGRHCKRSICRLQELPTGDFHDLWKHPYLLDVMHFLEIISLQITEVVSLYSMITPFPNTCCFCVQLQMMARNRVTFTPARGQTTSATTIPAFGSTPSQGPLMRRPPFVMPTRATWQLSVTFTMALLARCFCMFTT